jgi:hypothetical protein
VNRHHYSTPRPLTRAAIATFKELTNPERQLLLEFAKTFPDATITIPSPEVFDPELSLSQEEIHQEIHREIYRTARRKHQPRFLFVDIGTCRRRNHNLKSVWSDKTPLKVTLMCLTCSRAAHRDCSAAFSNPAKSFGPWSRSRHWREDTQTEDNGVPTLNGVIETLEQENL